MKCKSRIQKPKNNFFMELYLKKFYHIIKTQKTGDTFNHIET